jgi:hypothetical protein
VKKEYKEYEEFKEYEEGIGAVASLFRLAIGQWPSSYSLNSLYSSYSFSRDAPVRNA